MSKFSKIEHKLEALGFVHERNSGNSHALFRHGVVTDFKLTVPCTPKSYGALEVPLKKAELFKALLDSGMRYAQTVGTNILFQHKDAPEKVITIPSRPKGAGALRMALGYAEKINADLAANSSPVKTFNSKSKRKAWRKTQWKKTRRAPN